MCDQSAEQQRDELSGRQELAMGTLRCRRGLPYEAKSLHSGEEREYHVRVGSSKSEIGVCTSLPTTPHLVVGRSACRVGVGPSLNRSWAQRSRPVVQAGRRAFPGDESVVD